MLVGVDIRHKPNDRVSDCAIHDAALLDTRKSLQDGSMVYGADIEAKFTKNAATPLLVAATSGNSAIVDQLIAGGADVNAQSDSGLTPLAIAAAHEGSSEMIVALIDAGADVDAKDEFGTFPLHNAAIYGHLGNAEALLNRGADAAVTDDDGTTPLEVVCLCLLLEDSEFCNVGFCTDRAEELRALLD
ncbi:hypothetical protein BSKO_02808 [Bryopsis sp. KO-2023]|nr:hypothetical protein BSKO_02808 [Bryopsis sp. KO-2023]